MDGKAEMSLTELYPALSQATGHVLFRPALAAMSGEVPVETIALICTRQINILLALKNVEGCVVLLDRERNKLCPGDLAQRIAAAILRRLLQRNALMLWVVVKDQMFENWLIAATSALVSQKARFNWSPANVRAVETRGADALDALRLLKTATNGDYSKTADASRILARCDMVEMGNNSRSFRKLLKSLGHPQYT